MLKQRIITAAVLLVVLLAALLAPSAWPFVLLSAVLAGCALWEWLRLSLMPDMQGLAIPAGFTVAFVLGVLGGRMLLATPDAATTQLLSAVNQVLIPLVALLWVVGGTLTVFRAHTTERRHPLLLSLFGVAAVVALWFALAQIFISEGAWGLVSLMALIWVADTAAYFSGRALGRHKLAPSVSPGKTWEGAIGGVVAVLVWMVASAMWGNSFAAALVGRWGWAAMLLIAVFLTALSIMGDLFESLLKRRAGVKDSSQLLPGHGGVYDRIDALFPVIPVAWLLTGGL